jgi:ACS family glucarate transporter-like MFS transporter
MAKGRYIAILFGMLFPFIAYMDRVNLSIVATTIQKDFHLSLVEIGAISTIFFVGYTIMQIPGGILAERIGPKKILTFSLSWWSAFTILTIAGFNFISFMIIRFLLGIGEGPLFPGITNLYSRWLRKGEITTATSLEFIGLGFGPLLGTIAATYILLSIGWQWVFIIFGIIGFLIAIGFYSIITDMPEESKYVDKQELESIIQSYSNPEERGKTIRQASPFPRLLRSGRFWLYGWTHASFDSLLYVILTLLPLYLETVRHFSKASIGLVGTLPWALFIIGLLIVGPLMDRSIMRGNTLFKTYALPSSIGLFIAGIFVILGAIASVPIYAVIFLSIAMFFATFHQASWSIANRMGGKYSGTYSGWFNFWGNLIGGLMPFIVTFLASTINWPAALTFLAIVIFSGAIAWLFVKPDKSFVPDIIPSYQPVIRYQPDV